MTQDGLALTRRMQMVCDGVCANMLFILIWLFIIYFPHFLYNPYFDYRIYFRKTNKNSQRDPRSTFK